MAMTYSLVETDSCAALRWDLLSVWANAGKDRKRVLQPGAGLHYPGVSPLDMLRIGFQRYTAAPKPQTRPPTRTAKM
ncbi:hypothetical protein OFY05_09620 [Pseudocitrobacter faecalis]|nr:hypothetical protein OFY05_09620 [Pseudocitrobacter faecalis]